MYGISSTAGGASERRTLEQKVMLANTVAQSFMSADNVNSPGQRMFLLRRQNAEKWTKSGPDPTPQPPVDAASRYHGDEGAWSQRTLAAAPQHQPAYGPRPHMSHVHHSASQQHHGQLPAAAAPQKHGPAPPSYHQVPVPQRPAPQQQGYLRPARPPASMSGHAHAAPAMSPLQQRRFQRSESLSSVPTASGAGRGAPGWQMGGVESARLERQMSDRGAAGWQQERQQQQHPQLMQFRPPPASPHMYRMQPATSQFGAGVSDL